jgi:hypothetical protein
MFILYGPAHFVMTCWRLYIIHNCSTILSRDTQRTQHVVGSVLIPNVLSALIPFVLYGGRDQTANKCYDPINFVVDDVLKAL